MVAEFHGEEIAQSQDRMSTCHFSRVVSMKVYTSGGMSNGKNFKNTWLPCVINSIILHSSYLIHYLTSYNWGIDRPQVVAYYTS